MALEIKEENEFRFIDKGEGDIILLLHGLFGALSNWGSVVETFSKKYRVIIPFLPIYELPLRKDSLTELNNFLERFIEYKGLNALSLIGNSLGGHMALIYTLKNPEKVKRLILTGSSGLYENTMGASFPKRGNYQYIKEKVEYTFYDPSTITKEYIDEIFEVTNSIPKCMRIVGTAKSAQRHNMADEIVNIKQPTLLVWGLNDTITPPSAAHEFHRLIPNSTLRFIDKCCHAPMMERPETFNRILEKYLEDTPI